VRHRTHPSCLWTSPRKAYILAVAFFSAQVHRGVFGVTRACCVVEIRKSTTTTTTIDRCWNVRFRVWLWRDNGWDDGWWDGVIDACEWGQVVRRKESRLRPRSLLLLCNNPMWRRSRSKPHSGIATELRWEASSFSTLELEVSQTLIHRLPLYCHSVSPWVDVFYFCLDRDCFKLWCCEQHESWCCFIFELD
jgi:hypothetical protein